MAEPASGGAFDAASALGVDDRPDARRGLELDERQREPGAHLRAIHDMYRAELARLVHVTDLVERGLAQLADVRQALHGLSLRRDLETYGSICARFCQMVSIHHTIEDQRMFPAIREAGEPYTAVVDQLEREHGVIHELLVRLDQAIVAAMVDGSGAVAPVLSSVHDLADVLTSHFRYEETQLEEPLGLLGLPV